MQIDGKQKQRRMCFTLLLGVVAFKRSEREGVEETENLDVGIL